MRPLRMKESINPTDEAVLSAQRRAARKSRHKPRPQRSESLTPPRHRPPHATIPPDDLGFDESSLPPEQAYKRTRTDDDFLESLADANAQDQGIGYFEEDLYSRQIPAYASAYGPAAGNAAGIGPGGRGNWLSGMDEDEYAEYVRAGMWRRRNKDELERLERLEKERKDKEERDRREREKGEREERERIRRLEEKRKKKTEDEDRKARERYDEAWRKLAVSVSVPSSAPTPTPTPTPTPAVDDAAGSPPPPRQPYPLRFSDFPWPLYPPVAFPPLSWPSLADLTAPAIASFLLSHLPEAEQKARLRAAVLAYHPDRFERLVVRVPEEKEETRERVRELGLRVSQVLNELMKRGA
ncbi:hypothetical protein JCM5296_005379 [Sporobolomyces johnsonii]